MVIDAAEAVVSSAKADEDEIDAWQAIHMITVHRVRVMTVDASHVRWE